MGQKVTNAVADSVCHCLENSLPTANPYDVRGTVSRCVGSAMASELNALLAEHKLERTTVENVKYVQRKLEARMAKKCKVYKALLK